MNENKKIHEFALKYLNLFQNPENANYFVDFEDNFADKCFELGFKMDFGKNFVEKFSSKAAEEVEEFEKISEQITDAKFLGTAIFSKWRFIIHWLESYLLTEKFRKWFISAFHRLAEITDENFLREVDFMFNREIFKNYLATYKQNFSLNYLKEKYNLWEVAKCFQDNWNLDAENFFEMLASSLKKLSNTKNLIYQFSTVMLRRFAENEPETVRKMFRELFDENIDVWTRIDNFKFESEKLFEKYRHGNEQKHSQDERAISTYLWLRYPDKYYIYKITTLQAVTKNLRSEIEFVDGDYESNIRKFYRFYDAICEELTKDAELVELLKNNLTENCYTDKKLKTLTQDFGFYISKH